MERGQIDLRTPLRWRGTLRDEPAKLPWGFGLEIQLAGVDFENAHLTTLGGLRLSYSPRPGDPPLPELHAGDEVTVLTQAKRPQIFRDEGAFDRRTYLGTQGIDLVATLRSPELIDSLSAAPQTAGTVLARTRRQLREEVDTLFEGRPEVAAVKPRLAVISVGEDNPYGHPNAELLERLANAGVRVLRTDRDGAVHILMDGKGLEVRCFLPCLPLGGDELQRAQAPDRRKDEHQQ